MFCEKLRFQRRGLFELDRLPSQQLVLMRDVCGRGLNFPFELVRGLLELFVEPCPLDGFALIVQDGDHRGQLAVLGQNLAGNGLDRHRLAGSRVVQADLARPAAGRH